MGKCFDKVVTRSQLEGATPLPPPVASRFIHNPTMTRPLLSGNHTIDGEAEEQARENNYMHTMYNSLVRFSNSGERKGRGAVLPDPTRRQRAGGAPWRERSAYLRTYIQTYLVL